MEVYKPSSGANGVGERGGSPRDFTLVVPLLAVLLIVTLTVAFVWMTVRDSNSEARHELATDALWVDQYLRFQLQTFEAEVRDFAADIGRAPGNDEAIDIKAHHLVSIHPEFLNIAWRDDSGDVVIIAPPGQSGDRMRSVRDGLVRQIHRTGRPLFSPPYKTQEGWAADIVVPVFESSRSIGSVWAVISLEKLLERNVPWWVAGKYQVSLTDTGGDLVVSRSSLGPVDATVEHTISFDPPLAGLFLTITPYERQPAIGPIAVSAAVIGLAILVVINLWMAYRQGRRRAAAEQALRAEHAFRKAMESSLTIGMRARDREGRIIYVNPEFCRMVRYEESELIGLKPPYPYWAPEIVGEGMQRHIDLRSSGPAPRQFETQFIRPDGKLLGVLVYEAPLIDGDGRHIGWMGSIIDITERQRLEEARKVETEKLQHNARLITMGEMASTLAHELNQPLAAITSYATGSLNMLKSGKADSEEFAFALQKLVDQARRAGVIVHRVHDFVRKRAVSFQPHELSALIKEAISFFGGDSRNKDTRIMLSGPKEAVPVIADRVLIQQATINLIRNALEAVSGLPSNRQSVEIKIEVLGDEARIRVSDRGAGIAEELATEIFTPFVSSKDEGMGMGLPICRSILEAHKGRLWLEPPSDEHPGAMFVMSLPLAEAAPDLNLRERAT